jgi:hypothetical protein
MPGKFFQSGIFTGEMQAFTVIPAGFTYMSLKGEESLFSFTCNKKYNYWL